MRKSAIYQGEKGVGVKNALVDNLVEGRGKEKLPFGRTGGDCCPGRHARNSKARIEKIRRCRQAAPYATLPRCHCSARGLGGGSLF